MVTQTLTGTYYNGKLQLDGEVKSKEPLEVVVIFLKEDKGKNLKSGGFSFAKSLEKTKDLKGTPLSEIILQERKER